MGLCDKLAEYKTLYSRLDRAKDLLIMTQKAKGVEDLVEEGYLSCNATNVLAMNHPEKVTVYAYSLAKKGKRVLQKGKFLGFKNN